MDQVLIAALTALGTGFGAWLLHKRETQKNDQAGEVATAALHRELDARMRDHVSFVENRIKAEREWYERELEREKQDCADSINTLAGRLGITEARLREFQRTKSLSWEGGVPSEGGMEGGGS